MKLYELTEIYLNLLEMAEQLDQETFQNTLESIQEELEDKVEHTAKFIRCLEADIAAIKAEEKRLADRRRALEEKADRAKDYLKDQLMKAGIERVKRPTITVSIQNNPPSLDVIDETLIPDDFLIPQPAKIDKKTILERLKNGEEVPGVTMKQTKGLRIR